MENNYFKVKLDHPLISKRSYGKTNVKWRLVNPHEAINELKSDV